MKLRLLPAFLGLALASSAVFAELPAKFKAEGLAGIQVGGAWSDVVKGPNLKVVSCKSGPAMGGFDQMCEFQLVTPASVAGLSVSDGMAFSRQGKVVGVMTGSKVSGDLHTTFLASLRGLEKDWGSKPQHQGREAFFSQPREVLQGMTEDARKQAQMLYVAAQVKDNTITLGLGEFQIWLLISEMSQR